jgi:WD40 repeat protein
MFFTGAVKSVAISPDCKTFSSSSYDKTIRVWRISDASCIHVLEG